MRLVTMTLLGALFAPIAAFAAEPIATADSETPGLSLEVQGLKIVSGTLMLRFSVENKGEKDFDLDSTMAGYEGSSVDGIYLIDGPGKKKYLVVRDADNHCLCSRDIKHGLPPNTIAAFWAKFPPPPDSVQKIGVVVPHFIPMDDVPISR
jgi:hypothetical protein